MLKLQANSRELASTLSVAAKAILPKNLMPILDNVLLQYNADGEWYVYGGSNSNGVILPAPVTILSGTPTTGEAYAIPKDMVQPLLSKIDDQLVTLVFDTIEGTREPISTLTIEYVSGNERASQNIQLENGAFYPVPHHHLKEPTCEVTLPGQWAVDTIKKCLTCAAPAKETLRPQMASVLCDVKQDGCTFVASDGKSMYLDRVAFLLGGDTPFPLQGTPQQIVLPRVHINALSDAVADAESVKISTDNNKIYVYADGRTFWCLCLNAGAKFPNYGSIIPKENTNTAIVRVKDLRNTLGRISLVANNNSPQMAIKYSAGRLTFTARDVDNNRQAEESISVESADITEDFRIGFNVAYFREVLSNIDTPDVQLLFGDPTRAALMKPGNETDTQPLCLLMPTH